MKFILMAIFLLNHLYATDSEYLYQDKRDIDILVTNKSFKVVRYDGVILRDILNNEKFYIDKSHGNIIAKYKIVKEIGGVDIEYKITNPTNEKQPIGDFTIDGINLINKTHKDYINILNTLTYQYLHKRYFHEENFQNYHFFDVNGLNLTYPQVYSPVIVCDNDDYAIGSSLIFNYQKDSIEPHLRVYKSSKNLFKFNFCDITNRELSPHEELKIRLTIRFSPSKNWIKTLYPYKKHFNQLYGKNKNIIKKNLNPISGIILSYGSAALENYQQCLNKESNCDSYENIIKYNLFGYNYYTRNDLYGLDYPNKEHENRGFITTYIKKLKKYGYKRAMIWTLTGQYWKCPKNKISNIDGYIECKTNYPTQFINSPLQSIQNSLNSLKKFRQNGISLGLWWGRSGQIPMPLKWNPNDLKPFNIKDKESVKFYLKELKTALSYGVDELGLDAFSNMDIKSQLPYLRYLRKKYPNLTLYTEGSVCDFLHTQSATFLQPQNPFFSPNQNMIEDRAYLSQYLNEDAEIIVYFPIQSPSLAQLQKLISLGYTPLLLSNPNIFDEPLLDINSLKIK